MDFIKQLRLGEDYRWAKLLGGVLVGYVLSRILLYSTLPAFMPDPILQTNAEGHQVFVDAPSAGITEWGVGFVNFIISVGGVLFYLVQTGFVWAKEKISGFNEDSITPAAGNFAPVTAKDILQSVRQPTLSTAQKQALEVAAVKALQEKDFNTFLEVYTEVTGDSFDCKESK